MALGVSFLRARPTGEAAPRRNQPRRKAHLAARFLAALSLVPAGSALAVLPGGAAASAAPSIKITQFATQNEVLAAVARAQSLTKPPANVKPSMSALANDQDFGLKDAYATCPGPTTFQASEDIAKCTFGDTSSKYTVVLTGDSRAQMWFDTLDSITAAAGLKLVLLAKSGCPSPPGNYPLNNNGNLSASPWPACSKWHNFVNREIRSLKAVLVVISCSDILQSQTKLNALPNATIEQAFTKLFKSIPKSTKVAVLGGYPNGGEANPTLCLSKAPSNISTCDYTENPYVVSVNQVEQQAATAAGATYINETDWLCAKTCPAVIAGIIPYTIDGYHIDDTYAHYLTGALWAALKPDMAH